MTTKENTSISMAEENSNQNSFFQSMEYVPELFYATDSSGQLKYVNSHGRKLLGLNIQTLATLSVFDIHPDLPAKRWASAIQAAKDKGQWILHTRQTLFPNDQTTIEICIGYQNHSDGDTFFCLTRTDSRLNKSDKLLNFIAQTTAGNSGDDFLKSLMENLAKYMNVRKAFITECLDQPPSRVRMLAYWCANDFEENFEYDLVGTPCDIVINGRKDVLVEDRLGTLYPKEDGFAESYYGFPIYDADGKDVIGHIAILDNRYLTTDGIDCTVFEILAARASVELQRMRAELALKEREEKYRLLVQNQTDLIMQFDSKGKMLFASPSCSLRLGKPESELLNSNLFELIHNEDVEHAKDTWTKAFTKKQEQTCELRILTSQGWCWFIWSFKVVCHDNRCQEIIVVGRNISKRRRAEDQARNTIQQLAHVGRLSSMGEMASGIAHELNQPLTAIMSFSQASIRMLDSDTTNWDEYKSIQNRIAINAEQAGKIIKRVRSFVRKGEPIKSPIDISLLIKEVISLLRTDLRHADINIALDLNEKLPNVAGDAIQIQQVLVNLIRNAIEAICGHDSPVREIIVSAYKDKKKNLTVEVRDTGPGVPGKIREQLFDTFTTTKSEGLGIGLAICHTIIDNHSGTLDVDSTPNKGTTFKFSLPFL